MSALAGPPQHRGKIEAEAVYVHLLHPIAQRVHDQPDHGRAIEVQTVPTACVVHVVTLGLGLWSCEAVVGGVVQATEAEARPHLIALTGVVVDDVEDHHEAGLMQLPDEGLELSDLAAWRLVCTVGRLRGEKADRVIPPVVGEPLMHQEIVDVVFVDRQEFYRVHTELRQVWDLLDKAEIRAGNRTSDEAWAVNPLTCTS